MLPKESFKILVGELKIRCPKAVYKGDEKLEIKRIKDAERKTEKKKQI